MKAQVSARIARPVGDVWTFVAHPANMQRWVSGVDEPPLVDGSEASVGTRFRMNYRYGGRTHDVLAEVVASDPPRKQTVRWIEGPFPFEGSVELGGDDGGTMVTRTVSAGADSRVTAIMFAVAGPLLRKLMGRQIRQDLDRLQAALESGARANP
ncbi:MAG: hypothetical protein C0506_06130 [Anaerolinea sp.]|nr:hypothetical protein [Anaerolinea sp.]